MGDQHVAESLHTDEEKIQKLGNVHDSVKISGEIPLITHTF